MVQERSVRIVRRELWRLRSEAVFVVIAEEDLAEGNSIGERTIGLRPGSALYVPVECRLRDPVGETERLDIAHVRRRQRLDGGESTPLGRLARLAHEVADAFRPGVQHEERVRLAIADAPCPLVRRIGADIAEP